MAKIIKLKTEHVSQMKTLFEVLKEILSDTTIEFVRPPNSDDENKAKKKGKKTDETEENTSSFGGMRILTVSPDKTVLIHLKLHAHNFTEFVCKPKNYEIGVNLGLLNKMFKSTDHDDDLVMYVDNDDKQVLVLSVNNSDMKRSTESKIKLIENEPSNINLPPVEPDVMVSMNAAEFHKMCKDMIYIGQYLEIQCTNNTLIFKCEGSEATRETKYTANENGVKILYNNPNKNLIIQGIYELKHLNLFSKCASLSSDIQLLMRVKKFPLCIKYTVATLGDFIVCISPGEPQTKDTYDETDSLFQSEDEGVVLKKNLDDKEEN